MARWKLNYKEGDWFAVPLKDGSFGIGLAARVFSRGGVLGYFFGPKRSSLPSLEELEVLIPNQAVTAFMFGDLHLLENKWLILGRRGPWNKADWPIPAFGFQEPITKRTYKRVYSEDDLDLWEHQIPISLEEYQKLSSDGLYGAGAAESHLNRLLNKSK